MTVDFAFFHVGEDFTLPKMLCESIIKTNPTSGIIQLTDKRTPILSELVTKYIRIDGNKENLMFLRSKAYQSYKLQKPTLFLDTDMLVIKEINENDIFKHNDLVLCEREFDRDLSGDNFNAYLMRNGLSEFSNQTLYEVFPILGCFIGARKTQYLKTAHEIYSKYTINKKKWNGDQFALKELYQNNKDKIDLISENKIAYPLGRDEKFINSYIIHFKGNLKIKMQAYFDRIFKNEKY
jgi:hypothetical protein